MAPESKEAFGETKVWSAEVSELSRFDSYGKEICRGESEDTAALVRLYA